MSPLDQTLLLVSVVGLVFVFPVLFLMRRGLTNARVWGLIGRLMAGFVGCVGLGIAAALALDPLVARDIAACRVAGGYDCEDAGLIQVIALLAGILVAFAWLVLALLTRAVGRARGGPRQVDTAQAEEVF